ncbi:MAG: hypothetical protein MJ178_04650 [Treponemataceae bacterium]|nr:hypothetical protein [Treponemataceae bacterium]
MKKTLTCIFALCMCLVLFSCASAKPQEQAAAAEPDSGAFSSLGFSITTDPEEFDLLYYVSPEMREIPPLDNDDVVVTQAFELRRGNLKGEIRYSLFTDTDTTGTDSELRFAVMSFMCASNIAGYEIPLESIALYNPADVQNEFNADMGCTVMIQKPVTEFGAGYDYVVFDAFYKQGQGFVVRSVLFNDPAFLGLTPQGDMDWTSPFWTHYHGFTFVEKDSNGQYIWPEY